MKHLILGLAFAFGLASAAMAADPVIGTWKTTPDDNGNFGYIQVEICGSKICGTLIKSFDPDGAEMASENIGKKIIWGMVPKGDGYYSDGKVWSPDRDKTYSSNMTLTGNTLAVKGCFLFICRDGGTWTRIQ